MSDAITYEEYLASHESLIYSNVGTSMLPLLRQGRDLFVVRAKGNCRCRVGDVVLYRRPPSHYVLHRVVAVLPDGYETLGDNCVAREWVAESDVIGVMSGLVRNGRSIEADARGYRAYTWLWLRTERLRVVVTKALRHARVARNRLKAAA